jgi:prepilin-type processing-associated H-X9-DG protein
MGDDFYTGSPPSFKRGARRATSVKRPSEFILIADTGADAHGDFAITPSNATPGVENSLADVHRGGSNVLFCDGHVQWYLQKDLMVSRPPVAEDASKQRMWNVDYNSAGPW